MWSVNRIVIMLSRRNVTSKWTTIDVPAWRRAPMNSSGISGFFLNSFLIILHAHSSGSVWLIWRGNGTSQISEKWKESRTNQGRIWNVDRIWHTNHYSRAGRWHKSILKETRCIYVVMNSIGIHRQGIYPCPMGLPFNRWRLRKHLRRLWYFKEAQVWWQVIVPCNEKYIKSKEKHILCVALDDDTNVGVGNTRCSKGPLCTSSA